MNHDPILKTLLDELRRTKRARRARAAAAGGALALALVATAIVLVAPSTTTPPPGTPQSPSAPIASGVGVTTPEEQTVRTDEPTPIPILVTGRPGGIIVVSNTAAPSRVQRLDDDALIEELERTGHRAGLIRVGNEAFLDADWLTSRTAEPEPSSVPSTEPERDTDGAA